MSQTMQDGAAPHGHRPGNGLHFLWHLQAIGLIEAVGGAGGQLREAEPWARYNHERLNSAPRARLAIIDNGCCSHHPNLPSRRIVAPMEFAHDLSGTLYDGQPEANSSFADLPGALAGWTGFPALADHAGIGTALTAAVEAALAGRDGATIHAFQAPTERLSAHGTATAGLAAADARADARDDYPASVPFAGIDRFAEIVPIATVYSHEYWPMVMALLYAVAQKADVILIPRAVEEMDTRPGAPGETAARRTRFSDDEERAAQKAYFEALLSAVAKRVPVIVAAGNAGRDRLEYPAKLVGDIPEMIVVGAANSRGRRSAYSSYLPPEPGGTWEEPTRIVYAPSDDAAGISGDGARVARFDWRARRIPMPDDDGNRGAYPVVTIDIPGGYGYDTGDEDVLDANEQALPAQLRDRLRNDPELRPRSLYTIFGGTSAACAIVAGIASMRQAIAKETGAALDGDAMRRALLAHRRPFCAEPDGATPPAASGDAASPMPAGTRVPIIDAAALLTAATAVS